MGQQLVVARHDQIDVVPTRGERVPELDGVVKEPPIGGRLDDGNSHLWHRRLHPEQSIVHGMAGNARPQDMSAG